MSRHVWCDINMIWNEVNNTSQTDFMHAWSRVGDTKFAFLIFWFSFDTFSKYYLTLPEGKLSRFQYRRIFLVIKMSKLKMSVFRPSLVNGYCTGQCIKRKKKYHSNNISWVDSRWRNKYVKICRVRQDGIWKNPVHFAQLSRPGIFRHIYFLPRIDPMHYLTKNRI